MSFQHPAGQLPVDVTDIELDGSILSNQLPHGVGNQHFLVSFVSLQSFLAQKGYTGEVFPEDFKTDGGEPDTAVPLAYVDLRAQSYVQHLADASY